MPKGGFEPPLADDATGYRRDTCSTQPIHNPTHTESDSARSAHKDPILKRPQNIGVHGEYGICMGDLPEDLRHVINAWDTLPNVVKAGIVAMVNAAEQ
jgi:hypothetical protein